MYHAISSLHIFLFFFSFQGKIYVIGGFGVSKAILNSQECYDPDTDKWTKLTSMKKMCGFVGGTLVDRPVHFEDRPNSSQNNQSTKFGYYNLLVLQIDKTNHIGIFVKRILFHSQEREKKSKYRLFLHLSRTTPHILLTYHITPKTCLYFTPPTYVQLLVFQSCEPILVNKCDDHF